MFFLNKEEMIFCLQLFFMMFLFSIFFFSDVLESPRGWDGVTSTQARRIHFSSSNWHVFLMLLPIKKHFIMAVVPGDKVDGSVGLIKPLLNCCFPHPIPHQASNKSQVTTQS